MVAQRHGLKHVAVAAASTAAAGAMLMSVTGCTGGGAAADDQPGEDRAPQASRTSQGSRAATSSVRQAANVLEKTGTSKVRTSMVTVSGGTRLSLDGTGAFDYRRRLGRLSLRLPDGAAGAGAGVRRRVTEITTPGAFYMKNRGAGVPADKWVRLTTTDLDDGNLVSSGATDPLSAAELLRGARQVTAVGAAEVGGEPVRHYRGTVDLRLAARKAPSDRRQRLARAAEGFSARAVPFDAYVDGQGRLRKVRHRFTWPRGVRGERDGRGDAGSGSASGAGGAKVAVLSTTRLYAFGTPVAVVMPEPADIYAGKIASS
jgi:hypothetical protein